MKQSTFFKIFGVQMVITGIVALGFWWLIISGVTSGIKTYQNECGSTYGIENYTINGNLFCKE